MLVPNNLQFQVRLAIDNWINLINRHVVLLPHLEHLYPSVVFVRSPCETGQPEESIESYIGDSGEWGRTKSCPTSYYLSGASVRSEKYQGMLDDSAGQRC